MHTVQPGGMPESCCWSCDRVEGRDRSSRRTGLAQTTTSVSNLPGGILATLPAMSAWWSPGSMQKQPPGSSTAGWRRESLHASLTPWPRRPSEVIADYLLAPCPL